ncbi:hypothetical protein [Flavobacterium gilvum]|uniref:Uncharacterized protein n=1 Tax=Flavobacterium gilvum TaxID=1492737 RepID=A0AAC9I6Q1_9FLAO|nr:hypothetical protein [Flavobacterium gilvum]AOW09963.1 hypothetical protein EM308_10830 [Flavobacterium gilvum]KFC59022.1 hypothetical protein FEM08_22100 [Flavobacterium gilvum]
MKRKVSLLFLMLSLVVVQLSAQNQTNQVNDFLKDLKGSFKPVLNEYKGTDLQSSQSIEKGILKLNGSDWKCKVMTSNAKPEVIDLKVTFQLQSESAKETAVVANFDFSQWDTKNYVMIPGIIYNGNRYRTIGNGYMPEYPKDMYYNPDAPLTFSNDPQLSPDPSKPSLIDLQTGNMATPAVCFYSPTLKKGFILLTEQQTRFGNSGISVRENADRSVASIQVSAPSVRKLRTGFGDFAPSGDKAADWKKGDEVILNFKLYSFPANSIPDLLKKFMEVRKALTGANNPRNLVPMSKQFELGTGIASTRWVEVPVGKYYAPENGNDFQLGWVSGMMNTFPMLMLNDAKERERVGIEFDFIIDKLQGKSGYFYGGITAAGKIRPERQHADFPKVQAMVRKNCDALLWMTKHLMLYKELGYGKEIKPKWEEATKKLAQAFVNTWKKDGQFGQYIVPETGEVAVFNSTAGAIAPAGLAVASVYFGNKEFLEVAKASAAYYYKRDVEKQGLTTGHSGDISQDADADSGFGFLESLMALYNVTEDVQWLEKAKVQAALCSSWAFSYDPIFPAQSQIGKNKSNMAGAIWASTQNKHAAPGICTSSGDYLFKLYRATGDSKYAELIRDIQHANVEAMDMPDHRTTNHGFGTEMERIQLSDAEGKGAIGNFYNTRNSWCETNGVFMALELPGVYVQTDTNKLFVFDHVEAKWLKDSKVIILENKTTHDAKVAVFAETSKQAQTPMSYVAFTKWPKVEVKAGQKVIVNFNSDGTVKSVIPTVQGVKK